MKQLKFELFLIFAMNLAPVIILLCGQKNLFKLFGLILNLIGLMHLQSELKTSTFSLKLIV